MFIKCGSQVFQIKMIKSINYRISYIPQIKLSIQGGRWTDSLLKLPDRVWGLECTSTHFCFICVIPGPCLYISPLTFYPNIEVEASGMCVCVFPWHAHLWLVVEGSLLSHTLLSAALKCSCGTQTSIAEIITDTSFVCPKRACVAFLAF